MSILTDELDKELQRHRCLAKCNYQVAYWFSTLAVLASVLAGLSVASDWFSKDKLAILSALPGAILILFDKLKFEERSDWHYRRTYALSSLLDQLKFEGKPEMEISKARRELYVAMEREWPRFGKAITKDASVG